MGQQFEFKLGNEPDAPTKPIFAKTRAALEHALPAVIAADLPHPHDGKPRAIKAEPALVPRDAVAEDAFSLTLAQCRWHIASNIPAVIEAREIEGVHQMRVGLRRLRVALAAFGEEFRTPVLENLRARAKIFAQFMAPARDMDVFVDELFEPAARANGALEAFQVLRERAQEARREAWDDAVECISSRAFLDFVSDVAQAIDERVWYHSARGRAPARGLVAFETPAQVLAGRMLKHRFSQAKKHARRLDTLNDAQRHRLRIALKKLRYSADFFAPLYDKKKAAKFQKRLSRMQDILGALNDVAVARNTLEHLVGLGGAGPLATAEDLSFAAGIIYGWHLDRAARSWEDAVRCWKKFSRTEHFWETAQ
ncbi:MAG TPA: CHAD domain-containing protein [Rhizomicrobium sp.]|nr:CHAD domain-containing protein [Rhizomicrobium sp.]